MLAFDQFEEIFTLGVFRRADESKTFLEAIADLAEGRAPKAVKARLDRSPADASRAFDVSRQACRVLLSLREDYLAYLEDLRPLMPTMGNRMRLRSLNGIQAMTVVRRPGGSLVTEAVAREIVAAVAGARQRQRPERSRRSTRRSSACYAAELNKRRIKDGAAQISADLLTEQVRAGILGEFYEAAIGRVSATARQFVEDKLLLASGQRDSVAIEVAHDAGVDDAEIEALVAERLVRREERGGIVRLELTHDVLTDVVRASRDQRRERLAREQAERAALKAARDAQEAQRRLRRSRRFGIAMATLALVAVGVLAVLGEALYLGDDAPFSAAGRDGALGLQAIGTSMIPMPELVRIPAGDFEMGQQGREGPVHRVAIAQPFYLAKTETTFEQYDAFCAATGCTRPHDKGWGRGQRPVINVEWNDASRYAAWLSAMTGTACRLPSEAEWDTLRVPARTRRIHGVMPRAKTRRTSKALEPIGVVSRRHPLLDSIPMPGRSTT